MEPKRPDHPSFSTISKLGETSYVVAFSVGYYDKVPPSVMAANRRVMDAIESIKDDIEAIRRYSGSVVYYSPRAKPICPTVTEEMVAEFVKATLDANPDWALDTTWEYGMHGLNGVSVRIHPKPKG